MSQTLRYVIFPILLLLHILVFFAFEELPVGLDLVLEVALGRHELVAVDKHLIDALAELECLALLELDERARLALLATYLLLQVGNARLELGILDLELVDASLGLVQLQLEASRLFAAHRLAGLGSRGRCTGGRRRGAASLQLLTLDAEGALELGALGAIERVVVVANALDGGGQLAAEEHGRIAATNRLQLICVCVCSLLSPRGALDLVDLFGVHVAQEEELLLETLLVVLERQALLHLALELVGDARDLARQPLRLELAAALLVARVVQAAPHQAHLGLVAGYVRDEVAHALLVGGEARLELVEATLALAQLELAVLESLLHLALDARAVGHHAARLLQLDLVHGLDLLALVADARLEHVQLDEQLLVLRLQVAHALHVARKAVVELAQLELLLVPCAQHCAVAAIARICICHWHCRHR